MRYVIAIGGNALTSRSTLDKLAAQVAALYAHADEVVVTHGNGPQVGALAMHDKKSLAQLTKETEVEMGAEIRKSIVRAAKRKLKINPEIVLTHVIVDKRDREFRNPSKPIGRFYTEEHAKLLMQKGMAMKKLVGGYRRVVPSPRPKSILELHEIERALSSKGVVIAAGGGGIAVTKKGGKLVYMEAVIDKDRTSSLLAIRLRADRLIVLTNISGVFLDFHTKKQKLLKKVGVEELRKYAKLGHFERGSMLPKIQACVQFVRSTGNAAAIGSLEHPKEVIRLQNATVVVP